MPDIVTSKTFVDGEKGITATKLNQIISGAVIQPAFYSAKPASPTLDATDQLLELKGSGAYATITGSQIASSVAGLLPLADTTQNGMLRKVSGLTTDIVDGTNNCRDFSSSPGITMMRLRSFNAVGNSTFECDQRNAGAPSTNPANNAWLLDRYQCAKSAALTGTVNVAQQSAMVLIPGTNYAISRSFLRFTSGVIQASLAAGDYYGFNQYVEGPRWRELSSDVHSISLLVRSSVAGLAFSLRLSDPGATRSLVKLCTIPSANTWTLITLPNIPIWASGGSWSVVPGTQAYNLGIFLACGSTYTAGANDVWTTGNLLGAVGMGNFLATSGSSFDIAYLGHEPGPACTMPLDLPFEDNLWACKRYYQKSYGYTSQIGSVDNFYVSGHVPRVPLSNVIGIAPFEREFAQVPPAAFTYDPTTGAVNALYNLSNATHYALGAPPAVSAKRIIYLTLSGTGITAGDWYGFHYTVDTGW